jgi:hypothetical protein
MSVYNGVVTVFWFVKPLVTVDAIVATHITVYVCGYTSASALRVI